MKIYETELHIVAQFTYLESILATDCTAGREVYQRINKASAFFAQVMKCVITNNNL